jgi:hypothetical protein
MARFSTLKRADGFQRSRLPRIWPLALGVSAAWLVYGLGDPMPPDCSPRRPEWANDCRVCVSRCRSPERNLADARGSALGLSPRSRTVGNRVWMWWNCSLRRLASARPGSRSMKARKCCRPVVAGDPPRSHPPRSADSSLASSACTCAGCQIPPSFGRMPSVTRRIPISRSCMPSARSSMARRAAASRSPRLAVRSSSETCAGCQIRRAVESARFPQTLADLAQAKPLGAQFLR